MRYRCFYTACFKVVTSQEAAEELLIIFRSHTEEHEGRVFPITAYSSPSPGPDPKCPTDIHDKPYNSLLLYVSSDTPVLRNYRAKKEIDWNLAQALYRNRFYYSYLIKKYKTTILILMTLNCK